MVWFAASSDESSCRGTTAEPLGCVPYALGAIALVFVANGAVKGRRWKLIAWGVAAVALAIVLWVATLATWCG